MSRFMIMGAAALSAAVSTQALAAHDSQLWTTQVANVKLSDKWRVQQELVERFSDNRHGLYEIESNTLLGYRLSNETFLNFNTTAFQKQVGLDRMRNLIAINTPLSKRITAEIGYLNQHGFVRGGPDTSDHVASISLSLNL